MISFCGFLMLTYRGGEIGSAFPATTHEDV